MTHARKEKANKPRQALAVSLVGPWRVSTVDMECLSDGQRLMVALREVAGALLERPPLGDYRYETMVFLGDDYSDHDVSRYATEAEALAGHEAMCAKWAEVEPKVSHDA
jgi:hypothetical protein